MTESNLPGRTSRESDEYQRDHGHHIAAAEAYRYMWRLLESNPAFPLPASAETVIAEAHDAMQAVHATRTADMTAYLAERRAAIQAAADETLAVTQPDRAA